jgi:hypothetical protein
MLNTQLRKAGMRPGRWERDPTGGKQDAAVGEAMTSAHD